MTGEAWDTLHDPGSPDEHWSTDNVGEAAPGVLTPLSWSMWGATGDRMPREIAFRMGMFSAADRRDFPRIVRPFYGRIAMRMEYLGAVGDRMPGATGEDAVRSLFGRVPETMTFAPSRARYPVVAYRMPRAMLGTPRAVRAVAAETDAWWRTQIARLPALTTEGARTVLADAVARFDETLTIHSLGLLAVMQPLLVELTKLVERAGVGDVGALSGSGGAEMAIIEDIWEASRGRITVDDVIANHGFHGPLEGEASSRVWREDPAPLIRMISGYAKLDDAENPVARTGLARERLPELQRAVLAALPPGRRASARLLLRLAARLLPLRGVGKRAFLQSLDVARGATRRLGEQLELDAFYLTAAELTGELPPGAGELVARRRERRREYQSLTIPSMWRGVPAPVAAGEPADSAVSGIGVSAGIAEGVVRVVTDPSFAEVEEGEVLVTPTTDPSWASIMFLSSALVVDIGGALSHAAVVARELGIPCVVNTRNGSRVLCTGDRVRVDGKAGTVEVLERADKIRRGSGVRLGRDVAPLVGVDGPDDHRQVVRRVELGGDPAGQ
ncbi:MAG: rifampicin phosphotransferase [Pseudonocardiales bacterium]|nr:rifampicin phosphotransferase [Pseudonocardiales bacterium]